MPETTWEVWSIDSGNLINSYDTEEEALDLYMWCLFSGGWDQDTVDYFKWVEEESAPEGLTSEEPTC